VQLFLATPVVLWAGWPFLVRGWASLRTRRLNMFTLIAIGTGAAWLYSVAAMLAPGLFPPAMRGPHGEVPVYFEAAAVITVLVLLGQVLDCGHASARAAPSVRCSISLPVPPAGCVTTAATRRWASISSSRAIGCGFARATASRSTARCSKGRVP
jgi:Cu+-exporting ATPase